MGQNFLKLNHQKTEYLLLSSCFKRNKLHHSLRLPNGVNIEPTSTAKNLGTIISNDILLNAQVTATCKACNIQLRNISFARRYLTRSSTIQVMNALVLSRIDYHNGLLLGAPSYEIKRLQRVQNSAARIIFFASRRTHVTPLLMALHWLPVKARVTFKIAALTFRCLQNSAPRYLQSIIERYVPGRQLRSATRPTLLRVPSTKTVTYGSRAFSVAAPRIWNELPDELRAKPNEAEFRKSLKTDLYSICYTN